MRNRPWLVSLIILTLIVPTAFAAKEPRNEPVGAIGGSSSSIDWAVGADRAKAILTVTAPDGDTMTFEFAGSSKPS
ncbi:MAG TPA: hypothetical protein VN181_01165, partial [Thermoanaerobaculia bacterium]|nr:hypothetical protein [Thermoanaerobaculia bacterium]